MELKDYVSKIRGRFEQVEQLFDKKELVLAFDKLRREEKVDHEILYFEEESEEKTGIFVFGFDFFIKEFNEQEFKRKIGYNPLNVKIIAAYNRAAKKEKKVRVSDVLHELHNTSKDSIELHPFLRRMMSLSYYLGWKLEKDKKDIEGDYFIEIPDQFLVRLKQRYNFDIATGLAENEDAFMFLNSKGKINLVFKTRYDFTKKDLEKIVTPLLKKVFNIKNIKYEE